MFSQNSILEALAKFFKLDSLKENLTGYVEARVDLLKLELREDIGKAIIQALAIGVIISLAFLAIVFLSLGLALFLNRYFKENYAGFWIVAGFYLTLFVVSLTFKKQLLQNLENLFKERIKHKE